MTTPFPQFLFILIFWRVFCHLAQLCACFLTLLRSRACTLGGDGDHHSTMSCCSRRRAFRSYWSILILPCLPQCAALAARRLRRPPELFCHQKGQSWLHCWNPARPHHRVKVTLFTNATNTLNVDIWCDTFGLFKNHALAERAFSQPPCQSIGHGMRLQYRGHQGLGWGTHFKVIRRGDRQGWDHC